MNLKERVIELLEEYEKGKYSNIIINDYFTKNNLKNSEKAFITEAFYGVIRNLIFLDYEIEKRTKKVKKTYLKQLLRISFYQLAFMNSERKAVVWEGAELAKKYGNDIGNFINGVLRNFERESEKELLDLEKSDWAKRYSYPEWFIGKVKKQYGKKTLDILKSLKETPYLSVRINTLKTNEKDFLDFLQREKVEIVHQVGEVYYISKSVLNTEEFRKGLFIVQDGSSYLAAKLLEAKKGERILDSCSAPGSKSLVLASEMKNTGEVVALDIFDHKIKLINENAEKMGITNIKAIIKDAKFAHELEGDFDRVLVDAPCSGFGVLRKKPEALYNKDITNIEELAKLQYEILNSSAKKVKNGGCLIYSTCTIFSEENTDNARKFLEENKDFVVEEVILPENVEYTSDDLGGKIILDKYLDGFYIIKMKRADSN